MRRIVLDTETTGLNKDDRIIEVAAVELEYSRRLPYRGEGGMEKDSVRQDGIFHYYLNPGKEIHPNATKIHGISNKFLEGKPSFVDVVDEFTKFIKNATLIVHNASFDLYYLNFEMALLSQESVDKRHDFIAVEEICTKVEDTLVLAQDKYPGQSNSLDALIARLGIDASSRAKGHGALIDARLLGQVYEAMSLTQSGLDFSAGDKPVNINTSFVKKQAEGTIRAVEPSEAELLAHQKIMEEINS